MKEYQIVLRIKTSDYDPPDWIIGEIRDLCNKSKDVLNYASIELLEKTNGQ